MIVISHNYIKVLAVEVDGNLVSFDSKLTIGQIIYNLALQYKNKIIVWCHEKVKEELNVDYININFPHDRLLFSYNPFDNFFPNAIGYVEDNPFINVNKTVQYPTWQMSSYVGVIKAKTIILTNVRLWNNESFDYALNSIAKKYQPQGLFCYSEPMLLKNSVLIKTNKATTKQLFEFVNQHYKKIWVYLLLINLFLYEKKFPVFAFLATFLQLKKRVPVNKMNFDDASCEIDLSVETIDVIIPTIGRRQYLYDVLCDLKAQTHLPKNVIIVEQNSLPESVSELNYIAEEKWPFEIKHIFTHQTGACQARNKALAEVKSKWCFFADDDIVLNDTFLKESLINLKKLNARAAIFSCLLKGEVTNHLITSQTTIFGSGCSIVASNKLNKMQFDKKLEFGFGEDTDFGLQLRNKGVDILYFPKPEIIHLKASIGGFRTKFIQPWQNESPKPSPTVLYYKLKFYTKEQVLGYKTTLYFKLYGFNFLKLPKFIKGWKISQKWALKLLHND